MDPKTKLMEERAALAATLEPFENIISGGKSLDDEQTVKFDSTISEIDRIDSVLDGMDKLESITSRGRARAGRKTDPVASGNIRVGIDRAAADPMLGYRDTAEFCRDVMSACHGGGNRPEKLTTAMGLQRQYDAAIGGLPIVDAPSNFNQESVGIDGGYEVLPGMRADIWEAFSDSPSIINRFFAEDTDSNSVEFRRDQTTPWGSLGVQANWASEGSQFTNSQLKTNPGQMQLHKLYAFVLATDELMSDAPRFGDRITRQAARAMAWKASDSLINGNGAGQPLGVFNAASLVSVAKDGSQTADTITIGNVTRMRERLLAQDITGAFWLANQDTLSQIMQLQVGNEPVFTNIGTGIQDEPGGRLMGLPLVFSDHAQTLGDKGDIQLIAPRGYHLVQKRGGTTFASSIHLYFDYDISAFRWTFRIGGQPFLSAAISPANGSSTRSHAVTVDARA